MKNKPLVVITGASSGIGAATAKHFSSVGYPLLLLARRLDRLKELDLQNTICEKVDITDHKTVKRAIESAEQKYGPVDCIINNAGIMFLSDIVTQDTEELRRMYEVNVLGLLNGMQCVLPGMRERCHGTVINISSVAGRRALPSFTAYSGSKFAVHAISEGARQELAQYNVRVIVIAPGTVETELREHITSQQIKADYKQLINKPGRIITAQDIARTILFTYQQPQEVCIREVVIAPIKQEI